jgi:hypothetical protein
VFASFDKVDLSIQQDNRILLRERVVLDKHVNDLEVRVWVDDKVNIEIYGYVLRSDNQWK